MDNLLDNLGPAYHGLPRLSRTVLNDGVMAEYVRLSQTAGPFAQVPIRWDDPKRRKVSRILLPAHNTAMSHPAWERAEPLFIPPARREHRGILLTLCNTRRTLIVINFKGVS